MDIEYPLTSKDTSIMRSLTYTNTPTDIIILDSFNTGLDLSTLDELHKTNGQKMFAFHYFIDRLGNILGGRPERAQANNVINLMYNIIGISKNDTPARYRDYDKDIETGLSVFSSNKIFICLEGNTNITQMSTSQESSLINLCRDIRSRYRNITNIHSMREYIPNVSSLGNFVDMNRLREVVNNSIANMYVDVPSGEVSYTFGYRQLYYDSDSLISGNDVKTLQVYLEALGFHIDKHDGIYNLSTYYMVKNFQKVYNLPVTGSMEADDFKVINELILKLNYTRNFSHYYRYLKYTKLNPLHYAHNSVDQFRTDVFLLQRKLQDLNYHINVTGIYDEQTANVVSQYQKEKGYLQTGEVGPALWKDIMNNEDFIFTSIIRLTDPLTSGKVISYIQKIIYNNRRKLNISITSSSGKYDETTANNIKKIQMLYNLPIRGVIDEKTFNLIKSL